jgi:hypothetical protein
VTNQEKEETWVESAAFFYPRLVKEVIGSRDFVDDPDDRTITVALIGMVGIVGVPLTLVCGAPALTVRKGRRAKQSLQRFFNRSQPEDDNAKHEDPTRF